MKGKALLLPALALFLAASAIAGQNDTSAKSASASPWGDYFPEYTLTSLEISHELWLEATLAGRHEEVARIEREVMGFVNGDIHVCQERVRQMAREMVLTSLPRPDAAEHVAPGDSVTRQADFQKSISDLNAREALCRSLKKTESFSNKYRLLGDYIDLLRRELEMPRLKLASTKAGNSVDDAKTTVVPKKE